MKQRILDSCVATLIGFAIAAVIYSYLIHPWLEAHGVCKCH